MKDDIRAFMEMERPTEYYKKLVSDLKDVNSKLHIFNNINEDIDNGFPFSVKDNICVNGVESAASSEILAGYIPPFDATAVERLRDEFGFIGKTKMDEFGFGTFGINCKDHPLNPFDPKLVTGGSSGGAAAATSVLKYHVAIAESTGGSISCPSSFCGVVGFTPTYGLVSRYGLIDYANSLDKIGIIARNTGNIRYVFDKIKGSDKYDTTCTNNSVNGEERKTLVIVDQLMEGVDEKILSSFDKFISKLKDTGYTVEHKSIPFIAQAIPAYYIVSMAESSTNLAKYTGFKYGLKVNDYSLGYNEFFTKARSSFSLEAKRRVVLGTFVRSASVKSKYYEKALKLRRMLIESMSKILDYGFIVSPTMPVLPPTVKDAEKTSPVKMYGMDSITVPPNFAGFPHISFPFDYIKGLPVGAQLVTNHFNDYSLLDFTQKWEESFTYKFKYDVGAI